MTKIDHIVLSNEAAHFVEAQVASGRFGSVSDALAAAVEALQQRDGVDADRAALLRAAWEQGVESMRVHGPSLESDAEFDAFMDDCESDATRR
ncbi:MAG TPA: type II toxin-antitoxin system ParD family antitoxin [Polyangiaceae bacterium]